MVQYKIHDKGINMKKILSLLAILLPLNVYATVSCNEIFGTVYCTGTDGAGNSVNTTTNTIFGTTYTTGTIGDDSVNIQSNDIFDTTYYDFY